MPESPACPVLRTKEVLELLGLKDRETLWRAVKAAGLQPYCVRGQRRGLLLRDYEALIRLSTRTPSRLVVLPLQHPKNVIGTNAAQV